MRLPRAQVSVAPTALPLAPQTSVAGPELFTAGQRQVQQAQGSAARAFDAGDRILMEMQDRADADAVFRAEAKRDEMYLGFENAAKSRLGKDAVGLTEKTHEFFEKAGAEIGDTLETPRQKKLFAESTAKRRLQAIETMSNHESVQMRQSLNAAAIAAAETQRSVAAANAFNEKIVTDSRAEGLKRLDVAAQINGMQDEEKARAQEKYLTDFHVGVIKARIDVDPKAARRYFDSYKGEIDGTLHDDVEGLFAIAEKEHKAAVVAQNAAAQAQAADVAWQEFAETGKMPDLAVRRKMDGKARASLEEEVNKTLAGEKTLTNWSRYGEIRDLASSDPLAFSKMDLRTEYGNLAPEQRKQLYDLQQQVQKGGTADVVSFEQQLASVHAQMEWTGSSSAEKRGQFDSAAQAAVFAEQQRKGKPLTQEERQKVLDRLLIEGSIVRPGVARNPSGRVYQLQNQPDFAGSFEPDVPDTDAERIRKRYKERTGYDPTDEQIAKVYRKEQGL